MPSYILSVVFRLTQKHVTSVTNMNHLIVFRKLSVANSQNETNPTYQMYRRNTVLFNLIKAAHVAICAL